jgi:hypothetical protein
MRFRQSWRGVACALIVFALAACGSDNDSRQDDGGGEPTPAPVPEGPGQLRVGVLPDTQGDGSEVAIHGMEAVLKRLQEMGADIVIAVGDLTNNGTAKEFNEWLSVAEKYREAGMEILPLMGNHEDSWAHTVRWIDAMRPYIPADAVHMPYAEFLNYYVIRENVLIINIRYWGLGGAFPWIKEAIETHRDAVDHILVSSHDGLIGAKYGQVREQLVEGQKGANELVDQYDDIRRTFIDNDVIWLQGHEHQYQRSVVHGPFTAGNKSWTPVGGNYRAPYFTQIMSGNASYKGYEFRYGESELVQRVIQHKSNSMEQGSPALDATAVMLSFDGPRVDYEAWFTEHSVLRNSDGPKELADPQWQLFDRFSRSTDRCEKVVYPNSIPAGTRPVLSHDVSYRTSECRGPDGVIARIEAGENNTFNRVDSTTRTMSFTEGWSRAESLTDLMRLAYQYLYQYHQAWTPNLNGNQRVRPDGQRASIPATTIDLKKYVTLSWLEAEEETASSILLLSGTQGQNGVYLGAWGDVKDIEAAVGMPASQPDGSAKAPHALPAHATRDWDANAPTDRFAFSFSVPEPLAEQNLTLAVRGTDGWVPMASAACVVDGAFDAAYLDTPVERDASCEGMPLVGLDAADGDGLWWAVINHDVEVALIAAD